MRKHLSLLVLAIALFGAGCAWNPFAQTPVVAPPVPSVPPPPSPVPTPSTTEQTPPSGIPDGWKTFSYGAPVFSFSYPPTAASTTAEFPNDIFALGLGPTVSSPTAVSVPSTELHVKVVSLASPEMKDCFYSESKWPDGLMVGTQHLTIAGRAFCLSTEQDAAAGNRYNTSNYATQVADRVVVLSFTVHSVNCLNYDHPETQCVDFDMMRDTASFPGIVGTFKGAAPTVTAAMTFTSEAKTSQSKSLHINVVYPHLATSAAAATFNALMDAHIGQIVDQFKKDYEASQAAQQPMDQPWTLDMDYTIHRLDDHRFTIVETGSVYTGGAHPNAVYDTLTFDAKANKQLALADLFAPKTDYLAEISAAAIAALKTRNATEQFSDDNWIKSGAGPDLKNFNYFYYADGAGLGIIFPPYQVAAYAAGPQEIEIPTSTLKGFLP